MMMMMMKIFGEKQNKIDPPPTTEYTLLDGSRFGAKKNSAKAFGFFLGKICQNCRIVGIFFFAFQWPNIYTVHHKRKQ